MGFDASKAVTPLDYTLRPFAPDEGTIREPSDQQIGDHLTRIKNLVALAREKFDAAGKLTEDASAEDIMAVLADLDGDDVVRLYDEMAGIYSELCSGKPSKEHLLAVPMRVRVAFFGWLDSEVVRPEAGTAAGTAQVVTLPTAARG